MRAARIFKQHDENAVRDMALMEQADSAYVTRGRQHIENLERILRSDRSAGKDPADAGWAPPARKDSE